MRDATLTFSDQQSLSGTTAENSTNVYDAGSAKKLFAGSARGKIGIEVTAIGGTTPTFQAQVIGADSADLATNPIVLADTGTSAASPTTPLIYELPVTNQTTAKRYYGIKYTQTGTSPTATVNAAFVDAVENSLVF